MPINEYWEGNVYLAQAYKKSFNYKQKEKNLFLYLSGLYSFHSVSTALSNFHLDGKRHKMNQYLSKPFDLFLSEEEQQEMERKKKEMEVQRVVQYLKELERSWDRKHKEGRENGTTNR